MRFKKVVSNDPWKNKRSRALKHINLTTVLFGLKHTGEWQLTDVRALNDITAVLATVVPGMLQLLHKPEAKRCT